jgi:hypothetical protein
MSDIYFIRHNFNDSDDRALWAHCKTNRCIAIHFNREGFHEFAQYSKENQQPNFKKAFRDLQTLSRQGGRVVAQFASNCFQIGIVQPGTPIVMHNYPDGNPPQNNFYKTLAVQEMSDAFYYADYPLLSALRPPYQTIAKMSTVVANMFDHLLTGAPLDFTVSNLHPQMLELMCDECLRSDLCPADLRIRYSLLRTGKTLPVIDMYALTREGKFLCMQVTHATDPFTVKRKGEKLHQYVSEISTAKETIAVFAAPLTHEKMINTMGLRFLAIENIFAELAAHEQYKWMLCQLIGIR